MLKDSVSLPLALSNTDYLSLSLSLYVFLNFIVAFVFGELNSYFVTL